MKQNSYGVPIDEEGYASSVLSEKSDVCFYADDRYTACGAGELQRFEIFYDSKDSGLRELSKSYGAWVCLCPVHVGHIKFFPQMKRALENKAQQRMMERYGWDENQFQRVFGRDYLIKEKESGGQGDAEYEDY